jgi:hypothetical protein
MGGGAVQRTLDTGEVWELRGDSWHMIAQVAGRLSRALPWNGRYAPISADAFDDYAEVQASRARLPEGLLHALADDEPREWLGEV